MTAPTTLRRFALQLAIAALLPACAPADGPSAAEVPAVRLGAAEDGAVAALSQDELLTISLPARASTGYGWQVDELDASVLRLAGREQEGSGTLGGTDLQLLHFAGVAKGRTVLGIYHRRAWDAPGTGEEVYRLEVVVAGPYTGAYAGPKAARARLAAAAVASGLPTSYSACGASAAGYPACTPIKDQGSCGGCWAFATVGVFENLLYLAGADPAPDLSEQYLISCNTSGWSCEGGYAAFPLFIDEKRSPPEAEAGAVFEADFPFTKADQACGTTAHPHHEKLGSWSWVSGSSLSDRVTSTKQALIDHGPVWATVCADSAFSSWRPTDAPFGGSACATANHAVVLVGWDDNGGDGYWLLRNSWGSGWGDHGYMRIAWGANGIGDDAAFAVYGSSNLAPVASAGAAQTVEAGHVVMLDGSASADPDGAIASYAWTQTAGAAVVLGGASSSKASFTAPVVAAEAVLGFQLTVKDVHGAQSTASTTVTVRHVDGSKVGQAGVTGGCQSGGGGLSGAWGALVLLLLSTPRRLAMARVRRRGSRRP